MGSTLWTVWLSWTCDIFIDGGSLWIDRLVVCVAQNSGKQTRREMNVAAAAHWTSRFDLDSVCDAWGRFKLRFGSRDLKLDKLQPSEQLNVPHMAPLISLFCSH